MKHIALFAAAFLAASCASLPSAWEQGWLNPSPSDRPLRITHNISGSDSTICAHLDYLRDTCGVGGVVLSYGGDTYLRGERGWKEFQTALKGASERGMRVWIYDEAGYPSLGAGGLVLKADPSVEAQELCMDSSLPASKRYFARNSYEYTHASNNYSCARRYPDPANPKAMEIFLDVTHNQYKAHAGEYYDCIEAFFTDEPSFMSLNLGQIPAKVRNSVPTVDPLDPNRKLLPTVVWTPGLDAEYAERWGEQLRPEALFAGDSEADKAMRQRFWTLIGDKWTDGYMKSISNWCAASGGKAISSGHLLSEENVERYVPLYGNILQAERGFDLPGLDMLDSEPTTWNSAETRQWLITAIPTSASYLNSQRLTMTEISDHNQSVLGDAPVTLDQMRAVAGCQAAQGVTEFTLYYGEDYGSAFPYRNPQTYKQYCDYVARVNSIIRPAEVVKKVLLYYPLYDFQREYLPNSEELIDDRNQSPAMRKLISDFVQTGSALMQIQQPFVLADYLALEEASTEDGKLKIGSHTFDVVVIPGEVTLPEATAKLFSSVSSVVRVSECQSASAAESAGSAEASTPASGSQACPAPAASAASAGAETPAAGSLPAGVASSSADSLIASLAAQLPSRFSPACPQLGFGEFERDGRRILLVVNASAAPYAGTLTVPNSGSWAALDPSTGSVAKLRAAAGSLPISIEPLGTRLYVCER